MDNQGILQRNVTMYTFISAYQCLQLGLMLRDAISSYNMEESLELCKYSRKGARTFVVLHRISLVKRSVIDSEDTNEIASKSLFYQARYFIPS